MKIVHIITRLVVGGAQENTLLNVEDLQNLHGDEVTLIIGPDAGPEGSLRASAEQGNFRLIVLPSLHREVLPWSDFKCYFDLKRLLKELTPDVVHTHSSKAGILGRLAAAAVGLPVVHTVHGASFHRGQAKWKNKLFQFLERWAFNKSRHSISVCDAMTAQYVSAGIGKSENYTTIYSGMELEPFLNPQATSTEIRQQLNIPAEAIVLGKVARLFELKGHEFLLQIAPELIKKYPQLHFLFVGDGNLRHQIEQEIEKLGLKSHFHFTGLVAPQEVPNYLQAMDIVVHTSLREGLPRVLPQALIAKKPIISYDLDGAPEVCLEGETGFLVPPKSTTELAAAISKLIDNPNLRTQFGNNGHTRFASLFDHTEMTRQIRLVYERMLK